MFNEKDVLFLEQYLKVVDKAKFELEGAALLSVASLHKNFKEHIGKLKKQIAAEKVKEELESKKGFEQAKPIEGK